MRWWPRARLWQPVLSSLLGGKIKDLDEIVVAGEGHIATAGIGGGGLTFTARPFCEGEVKRTLLTIRKIDASDPSRSELERLRSAFGQLESEKQFGEAIIDFAESLIIGMDMDGTITIFNRKAEQISGLKRDQVLGRNYFTLFDVEKGVEGGKVWLGEMAKGTLPGKRSRRCREGTPIPPSGGIIQ